MHSRSNGRNIAFIVLCHVASLRGILGPVNLYRPILGLSFNAIIAWPLEKNLISSRSRSCTPSLRLAINWTHRSRVEFFRLVDWVQPCGTNQGHSARRLTQHGDERLVISICLASAFLVAANAFVKCLVLSFMLCRLQHASLHVDHVLEVFPIVSIGV